MTPSRRDVLGLVSALGCAASLPALAQGSRALPERFSSVAVDVRPLRALGLGQYAEFVRQVLLVELQRAFSDRIGGPGPRLVVQINALTMNSYAGEGSRFGFGGTNNDYLDGVALVLGPRGEVLVEKPQLSVVPATSGGAWYDPGSENRRVVALAAHFAGWLRRG
jgi:hypothetical protein